MNKILADFEKKGFYHANGVFPLDELSELEAEFDRIVRQLQDSGESIDATWTGPDMDRVKGKNDSVIHTHNVQQISAVWLRALLQGKFLDHVFQLLGPDIILHHSKLFQKPPEHGSPFPLHQDWS